MKLVEKHRLGQTNNNNIGMCCLYAKYAAFRRKSKGWLGQNQDNIYEWSDISVVSVSWHYI
jgi:hypothetical protein